jgi:hypothetical protein
MAVHVLALFEWDKDGFSSKGNTAVQQDALNFRCKNVGAKGQVFVNYGVAEAKGLNASVLEEKGGVPKSGLDLEKVQPRDKLVIFGHGDNAARSISEYDPEMLGTKLYMWKLLTVDTIYLCACEMGLGDYPRALGMALNGLVTWKQIRAPKGFVQISEAGRKEVFADEDKTQNVAKGSNKLTVVPKECELVF